MSRVPGHRCRVGPRRGAARRSGRAATRCSRPTSRPTRPASTGPRHHLRRRLGRGPGRVEERWGGLDVLVNNAGVAGGGRIDVAGLDEWQWIIEINLLGVVRGCRTFAPLFKRQRSGRIVNVASLAGLVHPAGMASYNAVKAAVVALTETLGHELAAYGVSAQRRVPVVLPDQPDGSLRAPTRLWRRRGRQLVETLAVHRRRHRGAVLAGIDAGERGDPARPDGARRVRAQAGRPRGVRRDDARTRPPSWTARADAVSTRDDSGRCATRTPSTSRRSRRGCATATAYGEDLDGTPDVRQFAGGASNLTYLLRYPGRDLILRRPPVGAKADGAHDMGREHASSRRSRRSSPTSPRWSACATTSR